MVSQTVLSQVILLLLFLYLLPLGGQSHPAFDPSQASRQPGMQDKVQDSVQMVQEQLQAGKAAPEDSLRLPGRLLGQQNPCFKERLDPIGISKSLGCKGPKKQKTKPIE